MPIRGLEVHGDFLIVWGGKKVEIYDTKDGNCIFHHRHFSFLVLALRAMCPSAIPAYEFCMPQVPNVHHVSSFRSVASCAAIHTESVLLCLPQRVEMCNFQGTCKQTLPFSEGN